MTKSYRKESIRSKINNILDYLILSDFYSTSYSFFKKAEVSIGSNRIWNNQ